jgi:hypothetical protein
MQAGRELDALVAEKVFSFTLASHSAEEDLWVHEPNDILSWPLPTYSTDIAAAWEVVEKFGEGSNFTLIEAFPGQWACTIGTVKQGKMYPTVPLAICHAALKVVGVEAVAE